MCECVCLCCGFPNRTVRFTSMIACVFSCTVFTYLFTYLFVSLFILAAYSTPCFGIEMRESFCVPFQGVITHTEIVSCIVTVPTLNSARQINCRNRWHSLPQNDWHLSLGIRLDRIRRPNMGRFARASILFCDLLSLSF